jgi:hypothetical protein
LSVHQSMSREKCRSVSITTASPITPAIAPKTKAVMATVMSVVIVLPPIRLIVVVRVLDNPLPSGNHSYP